MGLPTAVCPNVVDSEICTRLVVPVAEQAVATHAHWFNDRSGIGVQMRSSMNC